MTLCRIEARGLRNLESAVLEPGAGINYLVGPNASGKSSVLEAIYLLGRARSFRTAQVNQLIRFGEPALTVVGKVTSEASSPTPIGIRLSRGQREIHIDGRTAQSSAELIRAFPLLVIQPAGISLLEGAPKQRRQFMDFGAFHLDADYLDQWRRYVIALNHRNALLRGSRVHELVPWNHELARYGIMMSEVRARYIERLAPYFKEIGGRFFPDPCFELRIHPGWDTGRSLESIFESDTAADLRYGYTQSGPHKGDFSITLDGRPVKAYLSRGQMKLLVYALLLAQSRLMEERLGSSSCVLIDDVASELDQNNMQTLLELLTDRVTQYFITATRRDIIAEGLKGDAAEFTIAQGRVTRA